ncbi:disease resistance protein RUN1-like [Cornus florida]|uniref:disease resistance protein RUN1-like n=1 Tax=Cornus florida TaxID=4283 RepID=UPI0028A20CF6|nr:disease resistance protein RUN1-like [Cornus florida]
MHMEAFSTPCSYHVFLSFRGEDTRHTFTDHLYTALLNAGIRTFRDDDGLERGENISLDLIKAIEESSISVIVFSKDYASSTWCLDELLKIIERKNTVGHMILPVFYHVDPSDLRWLKGSFGEGFAKHKKRYKLESDERKEEGMNKIRRWKEALREVADLSGLQFKYGYESTFIQKIIKEIGRKLNRTVLSVCPCPVGLDSRINDINLWLQDGSNKVDIMAIGGMGGIGKTTVAKAVYNLNFDKFEVSSFIANISESSSKPKGLVYLQRQLLSNILKGKMVKVNSADEGIMKIKDAIYGKRGLVVLDDVDQADQLNAILTMRDWFHPGSKIIISTRNEQLLKANEPYKIYRVKELTHDESLQLFSWHAFKQDRPIEGYMEHSKSVVKYCGGIPLALQVLGSSLFGRSVNVWESALKKLEAIPDSEIIKKLRVSFDSLQDDHDKNLFLDIACFFVGKDIDFVVIVLDGCKYFTKFGIDNLIHRYLLTINEDNKLTMHQLLRDMGRDIVRQESDKEPGKRSRLWLHEDALNVLRENTGTETIEAIILNLQMSEEDRPLGRFSLNNSKRHHSNDFLDESTSQQHSNWWKQLGFSVTSILTGSSSTSNVVDLQTHAFSRMHNLRLLNLSNVNLTGNYEHFPRRLRWLSWCGFPSKFIPNDFPMESLVVLEMQYSSLKHVWKENKFLKSLKILNLSHSHCLTSLPDFSQVPNLESLILEGCINLIEIDESIGELGRLAFLNLKDCKNLRKLPLKICHLKSLLTLNLSGCSKLFQVPYNRYWGSGSITLSFSHISLPSLLVSLSLANCNLSNDAILCQLVNLSSLEYLDLSRNSFSRILKSINFLAKPKLKHLNISRNPISRISKSIKFLTMLESLRLVNCTRLQSLPELPMNVKYLDITKCRSLEKLTNLPNLLSSLSMEADGCDKLIEVQRVFKLEPIGNNDAEMISNLGLSNLEFLGNVEVYLFNNMTQTGRKVSLQGLYECGIFSTFVPGAEVPGWFRFKSTGSSICFRLPSLTNLKIQGLKVCVVYASTEGVSNLITYWKDFYIKISNRTKDLKWMYSPTFIGIPDDENKDHMIWLSNWQIRNQLEVGDEVIVSVLPWPDYVIKEFGIDVVFEQEDKSTSGCSTSPYWSNVDEVDWSAYQLTTGVYSLNHYDTRFRRLFAYDFFTGDSEETTSVVTVTPRWKCAAATPIM